MLKYNPMIWLPIVGNYADADVYASVIAYTDLLNQRGKPARAFIPFAPNYSIPEELRAYNFENTDFDLKPDDEAIILDVSVPEAINRLVPTEQILELIDHHPGYEDYWHERIGDKAIIEKIGAVATSIFEQWGKCWDYDKMSSKIAKLLLAAILDNTLNFNAQITTERDRTAATKLAKIAKTTLADFTDWYFSTVSKTILKNLQKALLEDCKTVKSPLDKSDLEFGQLTLWDAATIINQASEIAKIMHGKSPNWLVNILSISNQKNYILTSSPDLNQYFSQLLQVHHEGKWLISNQLYLRKEILAKFT